MWPPGLLILSPALKRWGALRRQGLCSHLAHLWASADFAPLSQVLGTPPGSTGYVATHPSCGPLLILSPALSLLLLLHPSRCIRETGIVLNLFRPHYWATNKTPNLWYMHFEGFGFCLHTLECRVRGRPHPNTDTWLFQNWRHEVDVEEVLTTTLPNEPVSNDEELDVLSNTLLASP